MGELNILNLPSTLTKIDIYDHTLTSSHPSYGALKITAIAPSTFGTTPTERSRWTDLDIQVDLKSIAVNLFTGLTNLKTLYIRRTELIALPASLFDTNTKLETLYLQNNAKLSTIDPLMFEKNVALVTLDMRTNVLSSISANQFEKNVLLECKLFLF